MTIFISILSYKDPTLKRTILDALSKADYPDRLVFGLGLQYDEPYDISFIPSGQSRVIYYDVNKRPGVQRGRYDILGLFRNEDYFLQIDSHTLFEESWDTNMIDDLGRARAVAGHDRVAISGYLVEKYGNIDFKYKTKFNIDEDYSGSGLFKIMLDHESNDMNPGDMHLSRWIYHGNIFCDKDFIKNVKFDQYSQDLMHEAYLSFSAYICGYDIYDIVGIRRISHNPKEFYEHIYGDSNIPRFLRSYESPYYKESRFNHYEMCTAFIYNDFSKFKINNGKRSVESFWSDVGLGDKYLWHKEVWDKRIYSNIIR